MAVGCSSTGISPRPMLMGAPRNALRAFNAGVSLSNQRSLPMRCHTHSSAPIWLLPLLEESWLSTVRQLALAFRIHLPYEVFKVQNRLYISQKRLAHRTSLSISVYC